MAKRNRTRRMHDATSTLTIGNETISVSRNLSERINEHRTDIARFSEAYAAITRRKADLARPFMETFKLFQAETGRSFKDFVRVLDPTVPADRDGYRAHPAYQAADYLRRSVNLGGGQGNTSQQRTQPTRTNAVGRMARLLSTILAVTPTAEHTEMWRAIAEEFALTPRQRTNLEQAVSATQPLFTLPIRRPVHAEVVHLATSAAAA